MLLLLFVIWLVANAPAGGMAGVTTDIRLLLMFLQVIWLVLLLI